MHNIEKNRKRRIIFGGIFGAVVMVSLLLIFPGNHNEITPATTDENTITETEQQPEPVPTPDPQPTPRPTPDPQPGILPLNWHSLTSREKTDLNPYRCPADTNGIVRLSAETGECLEINTKTENNVDDSRPETTNDNDEAPTAMPTDDKNLIAFGQPFAFGRFHRYKLELTVNGLLCQTAEGKTSYGQPERQSDWPPVMINNAGNPPDTRQRCRVTVTGRNAGKDDYLADGCGLIFENAIGLKGRHKIYAARPVELICTRNIIDFPHGASDKDTVFFDIEKSDEIMEIIIKNRHAGAEYILPIDRALQSDF